MKGSVKSTVCRIIISIIFIFVFTGIAGCTSPSNAATTVATNVTDTNYFTIAVLPDTQYYSKTYPAIFTQQTQWIADNAKNQHIVFVSQVGDLVDNYKCDNDYEWKNAQNSMEIIRNANIPYSVVPGNHDVNFEAGDTTYYDKYFPYTDFTSYPWYGSGQYPPKNGDPAPDFPPGSNASNFETFSAIGQSFIILNLACTPDLLVNTSLYSWANDVLKHYNNYKAIVVTHGYINTTGGYTNSSEVSGIEIHTNIVDVNSNIVAVICGHIHGEYNAAVVAEHGNTVENLLIDTQRDANGGDGWLRLYKFYPQLNKVSALTYSPYLNQYDTSAVGQFSFPLKMTQ